MRIKKVTLSRGSFQTKEAWLKNTAVFRGSGSSGGRTGKVNQGANVLEHGLLIFLRERLLPAGHGCAGFA